MTRHPKQAPSARPPRRETPPREPGVVQRQSAVDRIAREHQQTQKLLRETQKLLRALRAQLDAAREEQAHRHVQRGKLRRQVERYWGVIVNLAEDQEKILCERAAQDTQYQRLRAEYDKVVREARWAMKRVAEHDPTADDRQLATAFLEVYGDA